MKLRPSSLPALAQCPRFESDPKGSEHSEIGRERHAAIAKLLETGDENALAHLPEEDREGVLWAWEVIKVRAPMSDYPLVTEKRSSFETEDFETIEGTPDVVCGNVVFDLKWRQRDYKHQMAAYALMVLKTGWEAVVVHVLFAEPKRVVTYAFTQAEASALVQAVVDRAKDPASQPSACDYCGWCAKRLTCPAVIDKVNAVVANREDWQLATWHASDIDSPVEMGKALRIARVLADWCEAVEHHAKDMALKRGTVPTGFKLQNRQGNRYITSVTEAFGKAGLPQEKFLAVCEVKLSKLAEAYAEVNVMKKAPAERELEAKLGETVQRKSPSISLVEDKEAAK